MRTDPPRAETDQYWKSKWEKEALHNTNAQWLYYLRADQGLPPEQEPVTITMADIQEPVSITKSWAASGPDMTHKHWLKKLTKFNVCLPAQMHNC